MTILAAALLGYIGGTAIALLLDRMYTGAPLRGPAVLCKDPGGPGLAWTGALGYALLRGRCPGGDPLPARLWYLPLLGGGAGAAIALQAADGRHALLTAGFALVLLAFVGTDYERHLLPNRLMYPALAAGVALSWAWPDRTALSSLLGGIVGLVILFVLFLLMPGFGFGDVKLAALLGLLAGLANTPRALMLGMIAGGVASLLIIITRRTGRGAEIAYGPYLCLGAFLGMLMR